MTIFNSLLWDSIPMKYKIGDVMLGRKKYSQVPIPGERRGTVKLDLISEMVYVNLETLRIHWRSIQRSRSIS